MSDTVKFQKKALKKSQETLASINESINTLFECVKDTYAGDLNYVADKLEEVKKFIMAENKTKAVMESENVNADMRNKVNNFIVKYQSAAVSEQLIDNFFNDCYRILDLNYHPDEPFEEYVNPGGVPCFTKPEANALNQIVEKMFAWADRHGVDIYEVGMKYHPAVESGMGSELDLEETIDPEAGADQYEGEVNLMNDVSIENSPDYQRAYDEFMKYAGNNDEKTKRAAHKFAIDYTKDAFEDYA